MGSHSKGGSPYDATPTPKHPASRLEADAGMDFTLTQAVCGHVPRGSGKAFIYIQYTVFTPRKEDWNVRSDLLNRLSSAYIVTTGMGAAIASWLEKA